MENGKKIKALKVKEFFDIGNRDLLNTNRALDLL